MNSAQSKAPLISFVVPCYQFENYIEDCLRSILAQKGYQDFEIIVIDDASKDRSVERINNVQDPRIKFLRHEKNQGHVITINEGLLLARGKYIARIDGDDRYLPFFLEKTIPVLEKKPEVVLVHGNVRLMNSEGTIVDANSHHELGTENRIDYQYIDLLFGNFICAPTVIARREAWQKALPIPQGFAFSDWYLSLRMARLGKFCFLGERLADYRVHPGNMHSRVTLDRSEEKTTFIILDKFFEENESDPELQKRRDALRGKIYANHYLILIGKYLQSSQKQAARECILRALRFSPSLTLQKISVRNTFAALLPGKSYQKMKKAWRSTARLLRLGN